MEFFEGAKVFRLKCSNRTKYLMADEDEERVKQSRKKSSKQAHWYYELVEGKTNMIRIRSCWNKKYMAASDDPFLLGMTGKKVVQTISKGATLEWEVIKEGSYIKLRTKGRSYLKANPKIPPWRNSVTHVVSDHWTTTDSMILWLVDIVKVDYQSINGVNYNGTMHCNSTSCILASDLDGEEISSATSDEQDIQPKEIIMAKETIKELKNMDFHTIQSSERGEELEKAIEVLIADSEMPSQGLLDLQEKLMALKNEHALASQELVKHNNFFSTRLKLSAELKKDAAKARELEALQADLHSNRIRREELLKQLEEIKNIIKDIEKTQADNLADVEELISSMGQTSQKLEEMKREEENWQLRKTEAQKMLVRVEEDWEMVKTMFPAVE